MEEFDHHMCGAISSSLPPLFVERMRHHDPGRARMIFVTSGLNQAHDEGVERAIIDTLNHHVGREMCRKSLSTLFILLLAISLSTLKMLSGARVGFVYRYSVPVTPQSI